jgi:hypothetical protein
MMATRRGKAAQAAAEGISREQSVAAAFERMHAAPEQRLSLLERIKADFARIRAENAATEAAMPAPAQAYLTLRVGQRCCGSSAPVRHGEFEPLGGHISKTVAFEIR